MKAVLNVDGKKLEVTSIHYGGGTVRSVQVHLGNHEYKTYEHHESFVFNDSTLLIDFSKTLEFPELEERIVEDRNKLIEHLDELVASENDVLTAFAVEAMEEESLPFSDLALVESQKEYKLMQQRLLGFIDAVEEVKAVAEGYYADVADEPIEEEDNHKAAE